ncbi:ureidoglycolate lyase [Methylobacterium brachythecii]|uniref:Ureidoglycolate lyase n=1 Tax=Methylobacterium brachythecii TaxID=1176177 RepID=A0A7W6AJ08_9HYPH|nr:ureidoglycolate lyase [Methylobacterium brachythecii]MBB3904253.1 ureidoglycolate lyase [Methylobacterium brachythecii]GLS45085.1 ureidoglycolate lyase [Methylobacterium brachythecii]
MAPAESKTLTARPLTREAFAPFGDVLDIGGDPPKPMNGDRALRYHALAEAQVSGSDARVIVSIAVSKPVSGLVEIAMVERHPLGSQVFMPLDDGGLLVVVCPDEGGRPGRPEAFIAIWGQGVNYRANVWHGVLAPIERQQSYLIVDRDGPGVNLEEHVFEAPWFVRVS